jgi:hypothetical protein
MSNHLETTTTSIFTNKHPDNVCSTYCTQVYDTHMYGKSCGSQYGFIMCGCNDNKDNLSCSAT